MLLAFPEDSKPAAWDHRLGETWIPALSPRENLCRDSNVTTSKEAPALTRARAQPQPGGVSSVISVLTSLQYPTLLGPDPAPSKIDWKIPIDFEGFVASWCAAGGFLLFASLLATCHVASSHHTAIPRASSVMTRAHVCGGCQVVNQSDRPGLSFPKQRTLSSCVLKEESKKMLSPIQ